MAANILRLLEDWSNCGSTREQVQAALDYAPACDNLEFEDYLQIVNVLQIEDNAECMHTLSVLSSTLRTKYLAEWKRLGFPRTAEAWQILKWGNEK